MTLALAPTPLNPTITEGNIVNWIQAGQGFVCNGRGATSTNANLTVCSLSLFNPAASGKTFLVFSVRLLSSTTASTMHSLNITTTDPAGGAGYTGTPTIRKLQPGASIASVGSVSQTATGVTSSISPAGTIYEEFIPTAALSTEMLTSGGTYVLPAGAGISAIHTVGTAGGFYQSCMKWIEF